MQRLFEIQTLSERHRLADPIAILTAGMGTLTALFPNIFGGSRKELTSTDWLELIPGSGHWTTMLRNYLASRIHYDVDAVTNIQPFTTVFVWENGQQICGHPKGTWGAAGAGTEQKCMRRFYDIIREEAMTGGSSPVGQTPGGFGATINYETLLLVGGGLLLVMAITKKKKRR